MKTLPASAFGVAVVFAALVGGCASQPSETRYTNVNQPGPAVGTAVGATVGAVAGNVAGAVVAAGESAAYAAKQPFNNERRIVRTWRTEQTADGRTIKVPVDTEVDEYGRPIGPATTPAAP